MIALLVMGVCMSPYSVEAQRSTSETGWRMVTTSMRHFTGLDCPDAIGDLSRIRVLTSAPDRIAGCVYQASDGVSAVVRSHPQGASERLAETFRSRYRAAGFTQIETSGAAASGVSFKTSEYENGTRCETLWRFAGQGGDYTLWMVYTLPDQAETIGPIVAEFAQHLATLSPQ